MNFVLFLLLNAVLLIRPEELFPGIAGLHLYLLTIVSCTVLSLPRMAELLSRESLCRRPVVACVLLFFVATNISLLVQGRIESAFLGHGPEFAKVILYYILLIAVVDTPERFKTFIGTLVVLIALLTAIAFAQHYEIVNFPNIPTCVDRMTDPVTGTPIVLRRLVSSGIFGDPNDLCLMLGLGVQCCVYGATTTTNRFMGRVVWLCPAPLFFYAVMETHSRGGLLGVLVGCGAYAYSRFGGPKALTYMAAGAVVLLVLVGGRQASTSGGGSAHQRVMAWSEGFTELFRDPFALPFGLGHGWYKTETGMVAHNSFVEAFVNYGVCGGAAFLGAFYLGARLIDRFGRGINVPPWAVQARHFGVAILCGYAMGCYSITRNFVVPTYLTLGIASVLLEQAVPTLPWRHQIDRRWIAWFVQFGIAAVVLMAIVIQLLGRAGI